MEYRTIPGTDEKVSVIGLGASYASENLDRIPQIIEMAIDNGINLFDTVMSVENAFKYYKDGLSNYARKSYKLQMHFGSNYVDNRYCWSRDLETIKKGFDSQLELLGCEYADFGLVHCIDTLEDYDNVMNNGLWDYLLSLQKEGVIKEIGCSTHNPDILRKFIATGKIRLAMFSINMAYDYLNLGNYAIGTLEDRYNLYNECEQAGIALTVMKPFAGKRMLHADLNSFGEAFSVTQCIQYALDRPAVVSVLPGVANINELEGVLAFLYSSETERDYSKLYSLSEHYFHSGGECVYCNHCQPCPVHIDIGLVNKYYDLSRIGDKLADGHYDKLQVKADSCIMCGHCEQVCPFHVKQMKRMKDISDYYSKKGL
ncbi:oxidoreductase aldo/keto reductase family [Butyrivibrio proteoclasticus B316]|uniref:Oxidoreductase aldo/keto reductase family n=1 Tax=Butyrivibrio proteoclasticus (strain ATCC 51982 / DSM 14932 / B316) TaxID=515622 RepID=E0RX16_BUTPB|nr:aldo/keto reductase [Butyrivibrio proteoclasticus]ADL34924.1 oxidoreductase aldo/keto reductase family [Butyrivibrio proteoclasticus B316]